MTKPPAPTPTHNFREIGKISQVLPAYLRVVCRARFDCTPDEVIDIARAETTAALHQAIADGYDYRFVHEHIAIIETIPPADIMQEITEEISAGHKNPLLQHLISACPMQAHRGTQKTARTQCWSCPVISSTLKHLKQRAPKATPAPKDKSTD